MAGAGSRPRALHSVSLFLLHNPPRGSGSLDFPWHCWLFFSPAPAPPRPGPEPLFCKGTPSPSYCYCVPSSPGLACGSQPPPHPPGNQGLACGSPPPPMLLLPCPILQPCGQFMSHFAKSRGAGVYHLPQIRFVSKEGLESPGRQGWICSRVPDYRKGLRSSLQRAAHLLGWSRQTHSPYLLRPQVLRLAEAGELG